MIRMDHDSYLQIAMCNRNRIRPVAATYPLCCHDDYNIRSIIKHNILFILILNGYSIVYSQQSVFYDLQSVPGGKGNISVRDSKAKNKNTLL